MSFENEGDSVLSKPSTAFEWLPGVQRNGKAQLFKKNDQISLKRTKYDIYSAAYETGAGDI